MVRADLGLGDGERQRASLGHRVARVDGEVDEHLLEPSRIRADEHLAVGKLLTVTIRR